MIRVAIPEVSWKSELEKIGSASNKYIFLEDSIEAQCNDYYSKALAMGKRSDLLILQGNAVHFIKTLFNRGQLNDFVNLKCKKVFWSQDSHIYYRHESKVLRFFDTFYTAHPKFLTSYIGNSSNVNKIKFLPCSFSLTPKSILYQDNFDIKNRCERIIFPFVSYLGSERDSLVWQLMNYNGKKVLPIDFVRVEGYDWHINEYSLLLREMKKYKYVLNISLKDELNKRVFEALAANCILITNDSKDLHKLDIALTNSIVTYNQSEFNPKMIFDKIEDITERSDTSKLIAKFHTSTDRFISIIENEFGININYDDIDWKKLHLDSTMNEMNKNEIIRKYYSAEDIYLSAKLHSLFYSKPIYQRVKFLENTRIRTFLKLLGIYLNKKILELINFMSLNKSIFEYFIQRRRNSIAMRKFF